MEASMRFPLLRGLIVIVAAGFLFNPSCGQQAFGQQAEKKTAAKTTPTILFVCEHGAAKSVIAAAYFDKLAKEQKLKYKAVFRGTNPDPTLSTVTEKGLKEAGIDTTGWKPEIVTKRDMDEASQIITLGCTLPGGDNMASKMTDWNDIPSPSRNYPLARDEIRKRVQVLVDDLAEKETKRRKKTMR